FSGDPGRRSGDARGGLFDLPELFFCIVAVAGEAGGDGPDRLRHDRELSWRATRRRRAESLPVAQAGGDRDSGAQRILYSWTFRTGARGGIRIHLEPVRRGDDRVSLGLWGL